MIIIKLFEDFSKSNFKNKLDNIINQIPDSDIPSQTNIITEVDNKIIFTEGWCDRCFVNYNLEDLDSMIDFARTSTEKRMSQIPNLPQYRDILYGKKLVDFYFYELPNNSVNYALSVGVFE